LKFKVQSSGWGFEAWFFLFKVLGGDLRLGFLFKVLGGDLRLGFLFKVLGGEIQDTLQILLQFASSFQINESPFPVSHSLWSYLLPAKSFSTVNVQANLTKLTGPLGLNSW
jgi:hypothetical protein